MKLFAIFLATIVATSLFSNVRQQAEQIRSGAMQHVNSLQKKIGHLAKKIKEFPQAVKEKILSKRTTKEDEEKEDENLAIEDIIKQITKKLEEHRLAAMEGIGKDGNKNEEAKAEDGTVEEEEKEKKDVL